MMISAIVMNLINILGIAILINGVLSFPQLGIIGATISTKCE
ncbi:hypothetical protein [Turicibacter sanguinis]|nr:hypothetical protein [Turicibacter sanguinis]MDB8551392.1 hypothetical protein [Turicibacter sanguinis]